MRKRNGFTLAEMIAALALLAVFSVIVVQLFAASQTLSTRTDRLDQAVLCARNLAERWQAAATTPDQPSVPVAEPDVSALRSGELITFFLSEEWTAVPEEAAIFHVESQMTADPMTRVETLMIKVRDPGGQVLFELSAGRLPVMEDAP